MSQAAAVAAKKDAKNKAVQDAAATGKTVEETPRGNKAPEDNPLENEPVVKQFREEFPDKQAIKYDTLSKKGFFRHVNKADRPGIVAKLEAAGITVENQPKYIREAQKPAEAAKEIHILQVKRDVEDRIGRKLKPTEEDLC